MCTNKFILFCMGIVMSVSSSAWAGDDTPLYKDNREACRRPYV